MSAKNYFRAISRESAVMTAVIVVSVLVATKFQDFVLIEDGKIRLVAALVGFAPILFLYVLLRLALSRFFSALLASSVFYILVEANRIKQALTGDPLVWTDISTLSNFSVIERYVSARHLLVIPTVLGVAYLILRLKQLRKPGVEQISTSFLFLLVTSPFVFYPYINKASEPLSFVVQHHLSDAGIKYYSWDWPHNLKMSGLPLHLIQTSRRERPHQPSDTDANLFSDLASGHNLHANAPRNVIFILCEACWYDEAHFNVNFDRLRLLGFDEFRAISPAYGGGTVNAAFELLTGLPAHGALSGVIYQEYASLLRSDAISYPRSLKMHGYGTVAAHNHYRNFWKRDVVKPKLGFDEFIALEDMNYSGSIWAEDKVLFKNVLEVMKKTKSPGFYFLTTVHTHGGYRFDGDSGEGDYTARLMKSMSDVADFVQAALQIEPDSAVLLIGDHKPALTKFFFENGVLAKELFLKVGERNEDFKFVPKPPPEILGDVPGLFYHPDEVKSLAFVRGSDHKPFYCLSNLFDEIFVDAGLPSFSHARKYGICADFNGKHYLESAKEFPDYIYSLSLV